MINRICLYILFSIFSLVATAQSSVDYPKLTNIPTVYIETFGNMSITSKTEYIYANMVYVGDTGIVRYDSLKIRGRGNSTWGLAKKPYRIKFKESTKFLGKGYAKNKSWVFLANHADKSLLRNAVTFTMGEFMGLDFNPAVHFVDLVLNGTYLGNYQITDQVNVDNKRVEIYEQEDYADETANITGGYLLEVDGFGNSEPFHFNTNRGVLISIKSPDEDVINDRQVEYIKGCLNDFEEALFSNSFTDPENGYRAHVDSASFVDWYMATELSANVDGFWSTYMYKDKDDPKLYFGPLWDYDIAYNNCNRVGDVECRSMIDAAFADNLSKLWVRRALNDAWLNKAVNDAWKSKIDNGLVEYLCNYIDSMASVIDESQELNYGRYSLTKKVYNEIYLYSTYSDYIQQLKDFIVNHSEFLTSLFDSRVVGADGGDEGELLKPFVINNEYYYRIYNKGTNKVFDLQEDASGNYNVVMCSPEYGRDQQLWKIEPFDDGFRFVNRATEYVFNDPTINRGNPLNVVARDDNSLRQKWYVVTVNENNNYNVINAYTDRAINNNGGSNGEGNPVISYDNDDRNSVSNNRQWKLVPEELIPDYIDEEVKETLRATIAAAEDFISGVDEAFIGEGYFCYDRAELDLLQRMIYDAENFESTIADDYILQNVNLLKQLDVASKINLPEEDKLFVVKFKQNGYALSVASDDISILGYDRKNEGQRIAFVIYGENSDLKMRSAAGLFVAAKTGNASMYGTDASENGIALVVEPAGDVFYICTTNGYLGVVYEDGVQRVYSDMERSDYVKWTLEEYVEDTTLEAKEAEFNETLDNARKYLKSIDYTWTGEKPFQYSRERYEALTSLLEEMLYVCYESVEEYDAAINAICKAVDELSVLNVPDVSKKYNLALAGDKYLGFTDGLLVEECGELDDSYNFVFLPVEGKLNTYNISFDGLYLTVIDALSERMMALDDTPRGTFGEFKVQQTSREMFTLATDYGLFGVAGIYPKSGDICIPDASDNFRNVYWSISEAVVVDTGDDAEDETDTDEDADAGSDEDVDMGVADYSDCIDYRIRYNKESQTIDFVSYDIDKLADVNVYIYTTGGRLLYTFKAIEKQPLTGLPTGTYIIRWNWCGKEHTVKFRKE